jgi:hypothetical protein
MEIERPEELLRRLKLGREEYVQRLLTMLILEAPYPRWNSRSEPSPRGLTFLRALEELSFETADAWSDPHFADELDLPRRHDDEPGSAPDWAVLDGQRLWMIELKTEPGSHRRGQLPTYYELGRHHYPQHRIDLTYLTGPLQKDPPAVPAGSRFAHLTWHDVFPLVERTWSGSYDDHVAMIGAVLADLGSSWSAWRTERLAASDLEEPSSVVEDPVSAGIALARETAHDHEQRAVDVPVDDLEALQRARIELRDALLDDEELQSVRPWIWRAATTNGGPLTSNGAEVGYELRLSWYRPKEG